MEVIMQGGMKYLVQQVFYTQSYEEGVRLGQELIAWFGDPYSSAMGAWRSTWRSA